MIEKIRPSRLQKNESTKPAIAMPDVRGVTIGGGIGIAVATRGAPHVEQYGPPPSGESVPQRAHFILVEDGTMRCGSPPAGTWEHARPRDDRDVRTRDAERAYRADRPGRPVDDEPRSLPRHGDLR